MSTFWILERTHKSEKVPFRTSENNPGCEVMICAGCSQRVERRPWTLGLHLRDEVFPLQDIDQASMHLLASKRFQDLISANLLVGIKFLEIIEYEVGIKGKKGKRFLKAVMGMGYKGIYAVGSGGSIAKTSGVFLRKKCEICGFKEHSLALNGIHIDETQWDGSDFFQIEELPGPTFMSDRAKCILEGGGLSNFAPIRTEDYKVPFREHLIKRYRDEEFGAFLQP